MDRPAEILKKAQREIWHLLPVTDNMNEDTRAGIEYLKLAIDHFEKGEPNG